jgi:ubiquinone/menaquinone biosynthesis C-methylase UbiE
MSERFVEGAPAMAGSPRAHAFTQVDAQADASAWIRVLDVLREHPAYATYKARLLALLDPQPGGKYLDVGMGTGTGADAVACARMFGVEVVGVDASTTMIEEARRRGLREAVRADAEQLPFEASTFDGSWSDRTFQHLSRPEAALAEMVHVTKRSGRIVVVDPDYDTQVVDVPDQPLARRLLRYRADHMLRNGTLAHQMGRLFVRAGLSKIEIEAVPIVLRDVRALDHAMGLRSWAATAHSHGLIDARGVETWEQMLDDATAEGHFLYSFNLYMTVGTKE